MIYATFPARNAAELVVRFLSLAQTMSSRTVVRRLSTFQRATSSRRRRPASHDRPSTHHRPSSRRPARRPMSSTTCTATKHRRLGSPRASSCRTTPTSPSGQRSSTSGRTLSTCACCLSVASVSRQQLLTRWALPLTGLPAPRSHYWFKPRGPFWDLLEPELTLLRTPAPDSIFGNKLEHFAHKADVVRLQALQLTGGIYLDIDVYGASALALRGAAGSGWPFAAARFC
jgi:hypothetical protein